MSKILFTDAFSDWLRIKIHQIHEMKDKRELRADYMYNVDRPTMAMLSSSTPV